MNRHGSMNRVYRLVWNHAHQAWMPAAEICGGRRKLSGSRTASRSGSALAALTLLSAPLLHAGPSGGQIVGGKGDITHSGDTTTIQQSSQNLSINWQSFNIAPQETVAFVQPSASAIAVNRIFDVNGSQILGHLDANGQVYLINPNGIVFGKGAQVNVGGLVASTLDLDDASLDGTRRTFSGNGTGHIVNEGIINAATGGFVALLGSQVSNLGLVSARLGTVAIGAGSGVTLTFQGNSLLHMRVDRSVLTALARNGGILRADGGQVLMTAGAKDAVLASVVNNTGVIEARTVEAHDGTITLLGGASAGTVSVAGTLDAGAPAGGDGGHIETSAAHVEVADDARITTAAPHGAVGSWLVDPHDFTVAASGGDISGSTLSTELNSTDVTLQSSAGKATGSGDINVNDAVSWSANTAFNLTASNNVNINAPVSATGATASLVISPNTGNGAETASGSGTFNLGAGGIMNLPNVSAASSTALIISGTPYTVINSLGSPGDNSAQSLQGMGGNISSHYALGSNIDATATSTWNSGAGFLPINGFLGVLEGLGHTISNLTINRPSSDGVGLFGSIGSYGSSAAAIRNVGLLGGSVTGQHAVGSLVGGMTYGTVSNSYSTATVHGSSSVGGLVGGQYGGLITRSHATGNVGGDSGNIGGLVGFMTYGTIDRSYATGAVTGSGGDLGGLLGSMSGDGSTVQNSYATGRVSGTGGGIGGLVGESRAGLVVSSYETGQVDGDGDVGGLVGFVGRYSGIYSVGVISNSYATGAVTGTTNVGGLVGANSEGGPDPSTIVNAYATGAVSGASNVGGLVGDNGGSVATSYSTGRVSASGMGSNVQGLVGYNYGSVTGSFWNTTTSTFTTPGPGVGLTTAQMQTQANFTSATAANGNVNPGWDFAHSWAMYEGHTYPLLASFLTPLTVTASNGSRVYSGHGFSGGNGVSYSTTPGADLLGTLTYSGTSQGAVNVGSYGITPGGLYSDQQGYLINYASGTLAVTQLASVSWVGSATGSWSNAANWQGGAIPDFANVAKVIIPAGVTVSYDGTVPGTTTLASLADSGSLLMSGGTLVTTGNFNTGGFRQSGGSLEVSGALTINSGAGVVSLGNIDAGSLNVTSKAGGITQTSGTAVQVASVTTLTADNGVAGAGDVKYGIALTGTADELKGAISVNGANVTLVNSASRTTLGNVTASGNLLLTSNAGAITQSAGAKLSVAGATQLAANNGGHGSGALRYGITLSNATNNFVGPVTTNGSNITLVDGAGGIVVGSTTASGNFYLTSTAGAITQASGTALTIVGTTQLGGDNGVHGAGTVKYGITLGNATNDVQGAVTANGSAVTLDDENGLNAHVVATGKAALVAAGKLSVSGTVGTDLATIAKGGAGSSTTFGTTTVGSTLNVNSTGAVSLAAGNHLLVHGAGTATSNPNVTVNGKKGAIIP